MFKHHAGRSPVRPDRGQWRPEQYLRQGSLAERSRRAQRRRARPAGCVSVRVIGSLTNSFYAVCQTDAMQGNPCDLNVFLGVGGTSLSAPAFAGIMAMVVQKTGQRQGNANYVLYPLAAQSGASCASNAAAVGSSSCIFYDTVIGNNSVACQWSTPNCSSTVTGQFGVLVEPGSPTTPAWTTTAGYDLATGLGSVNATNLVNNWGSVSFSGTTTALALSTTPATNPLTATHGQPVTVSINVTSSSGTPTGAVSLIRGPSDNLGIDFTTLTAGTASGTTVFLPGGTYGVTAHYAGDGTFGASDSTPPFQVTVSPEASATKISLVTFDPKTGAVINPSATTVVYGSSNLLRLDVTNASGNLCAPQAALLQYACPTGRVTLTDNGAPLDLGTYGLNSQGYSEDQLIQLPGGTHSVAASYGGDSSYSSSAAPVDVITVTQAPTTTLITDITSSVGAGDSFPLSAVVTAQSTGAGPTGTVQFVSGSSIIATGTCVSLTDSQTVGHGAQCRVDTTGSFTSTSVITAQYSGDTNYAASSSSPFTVTVTGEFSLSASPSSLTIGSPGQSATATLSLSPAGGLTGQANFTCLLPGGMSEAACTLNPASVTVSGTGAVTTTLTVTTTAPSSAAPKTGPFSGPGWLMLGVIAALCMILALPPAKRRRLRLAFSLSALFLLSAIYVACGGGGGGGGGGTTPNPGTPTGTYTVGVTATSASLSHSVNVTVNVQ